MENPDEILAHVKTQIHKIIIDHNLLRGRSPKKSLICALIWTNRDVTQKQLRMWTQYSLGTISKALHELCQELSIIKEMHPESREFYYNINWAMINPQTRTSHENSHLNLAFSALTDFLEKCETDYLLEQWREKRGYKTIKNFVEQMRQSIDIYKKIMQKFMVLLIKEKNTTKSQML